MKNSRPQVLVSFLSLVILLSMVACRISDSGERQTVLDIPIDNKNDSLMAFDTLIIKVYSADSSFEQEVFHGKLTDPRKIIGLPLDDRIDKEFSVILIGYKGGILSMIRKFTVVNLQPSGALDLPITDISQTEPLLPDILVPTDTSVNEGESLVIPIGVTRPWPSHGTLIVKEFPPGASLDASTPPESTIGVFVFKPTYELGRSEPYKVIFEYSSGMKQVTKEVKIKVLNVNRVPIVQANDVQVVREKELFSYKLEISDPDRDSLVAFANKLPKGVVLHSDRIIWTPDAGQAGLHILELKVHDGLDTVDFQIPIRVEKAPDANVPIVEILYPSKDTVVNVTSLTISFSVNGERLQKKVELKDGENKILVDTVLAGVIGSDSVTIKLDTTPPMMPSVKGEVYSRSQVPMWTWNGGGGGSGIFRVRLDNQDMSGSLETRDTFYLPATELSEGLHTLFVQERDEAGNWSPRGRWSIRIDVTPPIAPVFSSQSNFATNDATPNWQWTSGGGSGVYRMRLDESDLNGAVEMEASSFTPLMNLSEGSHRLFLQERDSAGNWSAVVNKTITIDLTPPNKPLLTTSSWNTINLRPKWSWVTGGNGGAGVFRYQLNDSNLSANATQTTASNFTPDINLEKGCRHILYMQERDSAGNWSTTSSLTVRIMGSNGFVAGNSLEESYSGIILKSRPAELEWDTVKILHSRYLLTMHFFDHQIGYAAGDSGVIMKTIDGGSRWSPLISNTSRALTSIYFTQLNEGFVCGDSGTILKTLNGGATWTPLSTGTREVLLSIFFVNPSIGYAVGGNGTVLRTADGGSSWRSLPKFTNQLLRSIYFNDEESGFVVGSNGTIGRTTNGGESWETTASLPTQSSLYSVQFINRSTGFAVGGNGTIIKTIDAGVTWRPLPSNTEEWLHSIIFIDASIGYAVSSSGEILKTADAGMTWTFLRRGRGDMDLLSIIFP